MVYCSGIRQKNIRNGPLMIRLKTKQWNKRANFTQKSFVFTATLHLHSISKCPHPKTAKCCGAPPSRPGLLD